MRTRTLSRISVGVRTGRRLSIFCAALACAGILSAQSAGGAAASNEPVTVESRKPAGSAAKVVESRPSNIKVDKTLVLEVAFDSIHESKRHKSGLAMRFPRIARLRRDKPAAEADRVATLRAMIV